MNERPDAYMVGWRAGYNNATNAERKRILTILTDEGILTDHLLELIKESKNNKKD